LSGCEEELGERVATGLHRPLGRGDWVLVFLDSLGLRIDAALASLRSALGSAPIVGLGATASPLDTPLLWHAGEVQSQACAGVILRASRPPTLRVAHGFRSEGALRRVTRSRGLWIEELDGRPALEVYREAVPARLRNDPEWAGRFVFLVGLCSGAEPEPPAEWPRDRLLIRRVSGIDEESGAISLPDPVEPGRHIALVLRDPEEAQRDLADQLSGLAAGPGRFGCYLTCEARGATLFGGHEGEAKQLRRLLPDSPLLGLLGAYQLFAPNGDAVPSLHTHSAVLALHGG
jgi:small ligand-binding sensory domain FIST